MTTCTNCQRETKGTVDGKPYCHLCAEPAAKLITGRSMTKGAQARLKALRRRTHG